MWTTSKTSLLRVMQLNCTLIWPSELSICFIFMVACQDGANFTATAENCFGFKDVVDIEPTRALWKFYCLAQLLRSEKEIVSISGPNYVCSADRSRTNLSEVFFCIKYLYLSVWRTITFAENGSRRHDFISRLIEKSYDNKHFICTRSVHIKEHWLQSFDMDA